MSGRSDFRAAPRVTVGMPFLDTPTTFLDEAVRSVLAQTFTDWELLLVNDGSGPEATAAARRWVEAEPRRIRMLEHRGGRCRGVSASRNQALEAARADFVAFLDSDDVWLPGRLQIHVGILDAHPALGMVYGPTRYWRSWRRATAAGLLQHKEDFVPPLRVPTGVPLDSLSLLRVFIGGEAAVPCTCAVTVRTSVARRVGGFEEEFPGRYEDQVFFTKVLVGATVQAIEVVLDLYRQHADSMTSDTAAPQERTARRAYLEWTRNFLLEQGIWDDRLRATIEDQVWDLDHPRTARTIRTARRLGRRVGKALGILECEPLVANVARPSERSP